MKVYLNLRKTLVISTALLFLCVGCSDRLVRASDFSNSDVMFAQMMIPHHEQALNMSELAIEISKNPDVISMAKRIQKEQSPEIEQMKLWLDDGTSHHLGHDMMEDFESSGRGMMGMLDDGDFEELRNSQGIEFDRLFLKAMIAHHEGAIDMAEMIVDSKNSEAAKLGKSIIDTQLAEINEMKTLLLNLK